MPRRGYQRGFETDKEKRNLFNIKLEEIMKRFFKSLPYAIKKHILIRGGLSLLFLILFAIILITMKDFLFAVPCLGAAIFFLVNIGILLFDCITNNVIVIQGDCLEIEKTKFMKRTQYIVIDIGTGTVKIPVRHQLKRVNIGDVITVYLSSRTSVYENANQQVICGYYAIEVEKMAR